MNGLVPNRWAREVGAGMCFAALWCAVRAAPNGPALSPVEPWFYLTVAVLLLIGGRRLLRRDPW